MTIPTYIMTTALQGDKLTFRFRRDDGLSITKVESRWLIEQVEEILRGGKERMTRNVEFKMEMDAERYFSNVRKG